ncbi:D-glycero-beta-D-manno-heptose 1-phosphate adenylyltransferase [Cupriavidus sp. AU9028]|uniref:D-glycero-beta-D-manno-heptose 1-phosphate adenylyltransferase n=1 Tax=Cupriavidus sp. AU9028 TaxID=2871157 RepID=UPI001C97126C|nr:D-glycero-beta-D-manno-heptose 1-phosphate adenylyltransferase [Cupriavidus sp. AU9028]MBY4896762.1 D-glycero-beta-D-manno-heptose 1-phosphate adenylyltransferase [Cupriavidus sp. AU9028]
MNLSPPAFEAKLADADDAAALERRLAALPRPMVFTNGVFDILHRGHATYLAQARALGASLVVGVNSDASVRLLGKGDDRPLNAQADRMALLAALEAVDLVLMFTEQTPVELLRRVRPDIYVKGGDYDIDTLEETRLVRGWGGQAYAIPFLHDRSTTKLLHKVRQTG